MLPTYTRLLLVAAAVAAAACSRTDAPAGEPAAAGLLPPAAEPRACPDGGRLSATFYGALEGAIEWDAADMSCEGMPRPAGAGARLRFAGKAGAGAVDLAVIIAVPGLERGVAGRNLPSNVTLIEEGRGRFFSTTALDYCWVDVDRAAALPDHPAQTRVDGTLSCIAPLAEANGDTSVTIERLTFSGVVDWSTG